MRRIKYTSCVLIASFVIFFAVNERCLASQSTHQFEKIFYMSQAHLTDGLQSLQKNASSIDIIAPQMYSINSQLVATGSMPTQIETIATSNNIKVMPLITNQGFSQSLIHNLLISDMAQQQVISFLVKEALAKKYIGWQFDFEHIASTDRELYSVFVDRVATSLHQNNLLFSIAAVARIDDTPNSFFNNWSGAFDYARLASSTDFISIMTYDDPSSTGPAASLIYVRKVVDYLVYQKVPQDKISLGVPLYYWGWNIKTGKKVRSGGTYTELKNIRIKDSPRGIYSTYYQVPYLMYSIKKNTYIVWYENAQSIQAKLNLIKTYGLRGFSAWVLGLEDPGIWASINTNN